MEGGGGGARGVMLAHGLQLNGMLSYSIRNIRINIDISTGYITIDSASLTCKCLPQLFIYTFIFICATFMEAVQFLI